MWTHLKNQHQTVCGRCLGVQWGYYACQYMCEMMEPPSRTGQSQSAHSSSANFLSVCSLIIYSLFICSVFICLFTPYLLILYLLTLYFLTLYLLTLHLLTSISLQSGHSVPKWCLFQSTNVASGANSPCRVGWS